MRLSDMKISRRLSLMIVGFVFGIVVIGGFGLYQTRQNIIQERSAKIKGVVETAEGILVFYGKEETEGRLSRDQAQELAKRAIAAMRYDGSGYFWINDGTARVVMHPLKQNLIGKDMSTSRDAAGHFHWRQFAEVGRNAGAGFIAYSYQPPKKGAALRAKISYVKRYAPWDWIVGSGIYMDDVDDTFYRNLAVTAGMALLVVLLMMGVSLAISNSIVRPVARVAGNMKRLVDGETDVESMDASGRSEIADLIASMNAFAQRNRELTELRDRDRQEKEEQIERARRIGALCQAFDEKSSDTVTSVATAATEMQVSSETMGATAEETTRQASAVATASGRASANVETVASAAEELSSSIAEISRQVARASEIASGAVQQAEAANTRVQGLVEAADKIGQVVALITDIAEQTNLLALNATIEAARAGDAGKGFAVVASEVKNLANQTAKATDEIGAQITGIQSVTREAVSAIEAISKTIIEIDEVNSGVAAAVEEQGAATEEIARNVEQAAIGSQEVSSNIGGVSAAANETRTAAMQIRSTAASLSQQSDHLRAEVDAFLASIRSA